MNNQASDPAFEALLEYLKTNRGFDFTGYKRSSLMRRINHRMQDVAIGGFAEYLDFLEVHPDEFESLFNTILINVTAFFRDSAPWDHLAKEIIPKIVADSENYNGQIRVWSAGCASGEEAYSAAILFAETLGVEDFSNRVRIYATDVDKDALQKARSASYSTKELEGLPPDLLSKYFSPQGDKKAFRSDLRRSVIFGRHDLIKDAPISRLDLLICRNTLMYFNSDIQRDVLSRMHFALKNTGILFLGKAEMVVNQSRLFTATSLEHRMFNKILQARPEESFYTTASGRIGRTSYSIDHRLLMLDSAFEFSVVAQITLNSSNELVRINQKARDLLGLITENEGQRFSDLRLPAGPEGLVSLLDRAFSGHSPVAVENVAHRLADGTTICLDLEVTPLLDNGGSPMGATISFIDMSRYYGAQGELEISKLELEKAHEQLQSSNEELETTNEELQSSNEELETTNEELQSSNEELETTNEELQSANEEMETMNEELQATNEELQATNDQLRQSTDDSTSVNDYLDCILSSIPVGIAVLDRGLGIQSWNTRAQDLWGLQASEVSGESIMDLHFGLPMEQIIESIQACLRGDDTSQEVVVEAINRRGATIQCEITCSPLITSDTEGRGVVLLMVERSEARPD